MVDHRVVENGVASLAAPAIEYPAALRGRSRHRLAEKLVLAAFAAGDCDGDEAQLVRPGRQEDGDETCVEEAEWGRLADQDAENALAAWKLADRSVRLRIDAGGQEPLQLRAAAVDHAERRVAGPGDLRGRLDETLQEGLERQLRCNRDTR